MGSGSVGGARRMGSESVRELGGGAGMMEFGGGAAGVME